MRHILKIFPYLLITITLTFSVLTPARADVTLISLTATPGVDTIMIEWETSSELDTAAFFVQRSLDQAIGYKRVSDIIPAKGDDGVGAQYAFLDDDSDLEPGTTYYYLLESIETDGSSVFYTTYIVSAVILPPTSTSTSTDTPTATATQTATSTSSPGNTQTPTKTKTPGPSSTISKTPSITPTRTPTSYPTWTLTPSRTPFGTAIPLTPTQTESPTLTPSLTITSTATITPTAEIGPLPTLEYTLEPTETATPSFTSTPTHQTIPSITPDGPSFRNMVESGNFLRNILIIVVIIGWAVLAVGIYIYIKDREL